MGYTIPGCSVRFYQLSWYIPDSAGFFGHWWSAILALTERAEDFQMKITFTKYHTDIEGRESQEMGQMTATYNNEPLSDPGWQTRLIRVRTWNNVFLKPGSILCKVSGTKSSDVLWGELGTGLPTVLMVCPVIASSWVFSLDVPLDHVQSTHANNGIWWEERSGPGKSRIQWNRFCEALGTWIFAK